MKANAIKADIVPPQPDENFFPSARTKTVLSDDQATKARDRQRGGDRPRPNRPKESTRAVDVESLKASDVNSGKAMRP